MFERMENQLSRKGITLQDLADILLALSVDTVRHDNKLLWHTAAAASDLVDGIVRQRKTVQIEQQAALVEAGAA